MFLRIRFAPKRKCLFSVAKTSSETSHEARTVTQEIGAFGKRTTHSEKNGIGYENAVLFCS